MRLEWLEDIMAIAETGSFSGAAERRRLTQSAFSRRVRQIEEHIGVELFDRNHKPIRLRPTTQAQSEQILLLAAGLRHQLARSDLPEATRTRLTKAQATLWQGICATRSMRDSELWSWTYSGDRYYVEPFGAAGAHEDEANAAQLWSTVYLAIPPPAADIAPTCH